MFNNFFIGAEDHKGESALTFLFLFLPFAYCHFFFLFRYSYIILIVSLDCVSLSWHRNHNHLKQSKNKKCTSKKCGCVTNSAWNHRNWIPFRSIYYSNFQRHIHLLQQRSRIQPVMWQTAHLCSPVVLPKRGRQEDGVLKTK